MPTVYSRSIKKIVSWPIEGRSFGQDPWIPSLPKSTSVLLSESPTHGCAHSLNSMIDLSHVASSRGVKSERFRGGESDWWKEAV